MPVLVPSTLEEALGALADDAGATLLAGGTDSMVEYNEGRARPSGTVIALSRVAELRTWRHDPVARTLQVGAGVTWTELLRDPPAALAPALAEAARTVGSPQIRNAGTLGGNLATCSPAGDGLPVLSALGARVHLAGRGGERILTVGEFMLGVKRTALQPGEIITSVTIPVVDGWQGYAKVGVRNAMVIAVAAVCVVVDRATESVAIALGSVGPTVLRAPDAERFAASRIDWATLRLSDDALRQIPDLVASAARPITDHRSTAEYRSHAVGVLARRLLQRAGRTEGT